MTITLRRRTTGKKTSLYLDYSYKGQRKYEFLRLYLQKEAENIKLTSVQKQQNKETLQLAEAIKAKRQLEIQNGIWGFSTIENSKASLKAYLKKILTTKEQSMGNYGNWQSMLKLLDLYTRGMDVTFEQATPKWLEGFKDYLQNQCKKKNGKVLSANTVVAYYSKLSYALKQAVKDGLIIQSPTARVNSPKGKETKREFLNIEELRKLFHTPCDFQILKSAFLFSALTGLRHCDIKNLQWHHLQYSEKLGYFIRFKQQKTGGEETLPISNDARELLGTKGIDVDYVFKNLQYSAWHNIKLREWLMDAGITKKLTFHCARHTFATLQLAHGTDIFTVSKLLGHKNLKTTQVYAKVIDQTKVEAMSKIKLFA